MTLHLYRLIILAVSLFLGLSHGEAFAQWSANPNYVIVVREGNAGANANSVEKIPWHEGLTVNDAVLLARANLAFHFSLSVVSDKAITVYDESISKKMILLQDKLNAGDIVVLGGVNSKRGTELDRIPEIRERLQSKWSECKNRVRRAVPKA